MIAVRIAVFAAGAAIVFFTIAAAVRTVVLPRGVPSRLARLVFLVMRRLFRLRARPSDPYLKRDRIMAHYAPYSLLVLLATWLLLVLTGYTLMFWSLGGHSFVEAFQTSGSSIFTLGFLRPEDTVGITLSFTEAGLGLILLALLITYLPSIYSVFSRREQMVAMLEVRAGSPPWGAEMLERYWRIGRFEDMGGEWLRWEAWFVDLEESHTSYPAVVFFRSPLPEHSWVTAAGAVLDAASLLQSVVDRERQPEAALCIRAGYIALRRIATFFGIPFDPDPAPTDPISITRGEFDEVFDHLATHGVPVLPDRDIAWADFRGWRVNYDTVLVALASLTMAPVAPWSSDRSMREFRPPLIGRGLFRRGS